ncbi:nuclear transport factor 2 family protein [uncultured Acidaminococcus sp.]|uniref:nuclear transport factor 2 family protein n=1 Tax=uncultured Acidaminococcus sp. TaxID=352152 RepID=UPI00260A82B6|nr:nuclear transport factor 2 family protein [uncultured Acidaminococcus sp.]
MLEMTKEYNAVRRTIDDYIEGANGDMVRLKRAYHKNALINGMPIQALFDSVERNGRTNATGRLDYLDISGQAASAKVIIENWHGNQYVEYLQLLKFPQTGWQIISKAFDGYYGA